MIKKNVYVYRIFDAGNRKQFPRFGEVVEDISPPLQKAFSVLKHFRSFLTGSSKQFC